MANAVPPSRLFEFHCSQKSRENANNCRRVKFVQDIPKESNFIYC